MMNRKAVALISGGLDSALAIQLVKEQGVEVTALHFTSFFSGGDPKAADSPVVLIARHLGVPVIYRPKGEDFLEIIRNPRFGHGKNLNPCVDCRIYTFIAAKRVMDEIGASFIVTGEVVGQRPMSQQRHTMRLIEKRSGCEGIVLRPLSAKLLPPTLPEQEGVVAREKLLDVSGRGRKTQLGMAEQLGLTGYSTPAGGCLLTDKIFSRRLKDILDERYELPPEELNLLTVGRHIRLRPGLKVIVGRNQTENRRLQDAASLGYFFSPVGFPGPSGLALGDLSPRDETIIGSIIRRYAKEATRGEWIEIRGPGSENCRIKVSDVALEEWIAHRMI